MKNIKFIIPVLCVSLLFAACRKNFLDREPLSNISDKDSWKSVSDLRLSANGFYSSLPHYIQEFMNFGIYSEDDKQGSDNMVNYQYLTFLNGERTLPSISEEWSYNAWKNVRSANYFLGKYENVTGDKDDINKYLGEVLFFKAWNYFIKLKQFGDLPWISKSFDQNDSTVLKSPRLSRTVVVDSMMEILDKAIELLPAKGTGKYEDFRVYKELAAAFQSRVALYEGTWEKYHAGTDFGVKGSDGSRFLKKAAEAAELVMQSGKFGLDNVGEENGYWKLFNQISYAGSKEIMFWRQYNLADGAYTLWARTMSRGGGGRGVTKSLVDDYLCTDGKPASASSLYQGDETLVKVITDRDPRLTQTIQVNDGKHFLNDTTVFKYPAWSVAAEDNNYTGYQLYKGLSTDPQQQVVGNGTQGLIYFRYAEVLLNYAEAKAELGTLTQADVDQTINLLRDRIKMSRLNIASITPDPKWKFSKLSPVINEVRRERRVELACEGYRHDDIWRWAAAGTLIKGWKPKGAKRAQFIAIAPPQEIATVQALYPIDGEGYIFPYKNNVIGASGFNFKTERDYLLPLPTNQLQLNTRLMQNPGWGKQ